MATWTNDGKNVSSFSNDSLHTASYTNDANSSIFGGAGSATGLLCSPTYPSSVTLITWANDTKN